LYQPQLRGGRWLVPQDSQAVVLNEDLAEDLGAGIGDWVTIDHGVDGETHWQVVGLLFDPLITNSIHVPRETMMHDLGMVGKVNTVWIQTQEDDPAAEEAVHLDLRQIYEQRGIEVSPGGTFGVGVTSSEIVSYFDGQFGFIISLLATMAIVIAVVGSVALSGVLSLSVMERRREIGVMRAIGAPSRAIAGLMIGEGLILSWLSWIIALPLSIPGGWLMAQGLGTAFDITFVYRYTPVGAFYWLGIITVLAIVASWFPARGAIKISVRESLAYQ
jgi:putative ABC transport system permease protein